MNRRLKAVRIGCTVIFVLAPLCWLVVNAGTWPFYVDANGRPTLGSIFCLITCWLPLPSLACAIAASVLAKKPQPPKKLAIAAGLLALAAGLLLIVPFGFTLLEL